MTGSHVGHTTPPCKAPRAAIGVAMDVARDACPGRCKQASQGRTALGRVGGRGELPMHVVCFFEGQELESERCRLLLLGVVAVAQAHVAVVGLARECRRRAGDGAGARLDEGIDLDACVPQSNIRFSGGAKPARFSTTQ